MEPVLLIVFDGFGYRKIQEWNAVSPATMPFYHSLLQKYPHSLLEASGEAVGLPTGTMGNSEVGHLHIGAGRVMYQDYSRINKAIGDRSFFQNQTIIDFMKRADTVHILGLLSDSGVHAHVNHIVALVEVAKRLGAKVRVHLFTDGRDMDPHSSLPLLKIVRTAEDAHVRIATIGGRFFGMDRDKRWERIEKAYRAIVEGNGAKSKTATEAITQAYDRDESDEFITPTVIGDYAGFQDGDAVVFANFRSDRTRQFCAALRRKDFKEFPLFEHDIPLLTMTMYDEKWDAPVAFPGQQPVNTLAEALSMAGLKQLHLAETEKYAHVTYFFNGGVEQQFPGEDRDLIPSQKVTTYDHAPHMSAEQVTDELLKQLKKGLHHFILVNYANADMVAHTGKFDAACKAMTLLDKQLERIVKANAKYTIALTADHGNCEEMTGKLTTAHTTNKVPFLILKENLSLKDGGLSDVAPTILKMMGLDIPMQMTGNVLI